MMFWVRVWRRVHKPLYFLGFCIFFIFPLYTTNCQTFDNIDNAKLGDSMGKFGHSETEFVLRHRTSDSNVPPNEVPLPGSSFHQLPFCPPKSGSESGDVSSEKNSSDELQRSGPDPSRRIFVATLDGKLSLLDHAGKELWSISTGHLFSSTISTLQLNENGKWITLIPSLTGGLYKYDGVNIEPIPLTADSLLKKSFKLSQDVVISGGKEIQTFGVDMNSGNMKYECGMKGCKSFSKAEYDATQDGNVVLVVKKQLQTVRAIDSVTGSERWNFSVGTHELALAGLTEGCYETAYKDDADLPSQNYLLQMSFSNDVMDGLMGFDRTNAPWKTQFENPISQVWLWEKGRLISIDPIKSSAVNHLQPVFWVGKHLKQLYVQESHESAANLENMLSFDRHAIEDGSRKPLKIGWKTTDNSKNENTAIAQVSSSNFAISPSSKFKGVFVFKSDEFQIPAIEAPPADPTLQPSRSDSDDSDSEMGDEFDGPIQIMVVSLLYYWKEVLGISILTAVLLNILLMRPVMRFVRARTVRDMVMLFRNFRQNQNEDQKALVPRKVSEPELLPIPVPSSSRQRSTSNSSSSSQQFVYQEGDQFVSQYLREFEPIQCLGKGGFGVVFEAKKKIDDRHYAVKRIPLPTGQKSQNRVMREVKALARLEHRYIVRYFNAWIETPPLFWLEKNDPLWNSRILDSPSGTNPGGFYGSQSYSQSNYSYSNANKDMNLRKRDHFEISVPTPVDEAQEVEDSFIVFGEESVLEPEIERAIDEASRRAIGDSCIMSQNSTCEISQKGFFARPTSLSIPSSTGDKNEFSQFDEDDPFEAPEPKTVMYLYIQQELCQNKTLQDWLKTEKERDLKTVISFFAQIVEAVEYIHSKGLIHRDMKPSNIFLAGGDDDDDTIVKIGDFGLATTIINEIENQSTTSQMIDLSPMVMKASLTGQVGTSLYMSPEQKSKKPYDHKVDIYSLGLIFVELITPFSTDMERHSTISQFRHLDFPPDFITKHPDEFDIIEKMVSHRPEERPETKDIKAKVTTYLSKISSQANPITLTNTDFNVNKIKEYDERPRRFASQKNMTIKARSFM